MKNENKRKFALWIHQSAIDKVSQFYKDGNCDSISEYIEKAVKFYNGYLTQEHNVNYLSPLITNSVDATIIGTEQRLARLLFKIAVEQGKTANILAAMNGIDEETMRSLHIIVVEEVKKINGILTHEKALKYQKD